MSVPMQSHSVKRLIGSNGLNASNWDKGYFFSWISKKTRLSFMVEVTSRTGL